MGDAPCEMDWLMKPLASRELTASPSQGLLRSLHFHHPRQQHLTGLLLQLGQLHVGDGGGGPLHTAVDLDGDGKVTLDEILGVTSYIKTMQLKELFNMYDLDGDGQIDVDEMCVLRAQWKVFILRRCR